MPSSTAYSRSPAKNDTDIAVEAVSCALCHSSIQQARYQLRHGSIVECVNCGFSYVSPRMLSALLRDKLQRWAVQDVVDQERLRIAFDAQTLKLYRSYVNRLSAIVKPGRLLDVGCSTGALLVVATESGWLAAGLEVGGASSKFARETLGLDVTNGSLYSFNAEPESYDAIVFMEVIEHLEHPAEAVERLASWLKPGGVLLISTPNYDSLFRRLFGTKWWVVSCEDEHIQFFTPASLRRLLESQNLDVTWQCIRGLDMPGMWRVFRDSMRSAKSPPAKSTASASDAPVNIETSAASPGDNGYHRTRSQKERIKSALSKLGLLGVARGVISAVDFFGSIKGSPIFAWGEQIVVIAVKRRKNE